MEQMKAISTSLHSGHARNMSSCMYIGLNASFEQPKRQKYFSHPHHNHSSETAREVLSLGALKAMA